MNIIKTELLKQKKMIFILCMLFPLLINALLYVDLTYRYNAYLLIHQSEYGLSNWQLIFKEQTIFYFSELCHLVAAAVVYEIFSVELKNNGWMLVASSQYREKKVVYGKYMVAILALLLFFFVDYTGLLFIGKLIGVQGKVDIVLFIKSLSMQLISTSMMASFYIFIVCLIKRITYLIPVGFLFMVMNIVLYYTDHVKLLIQYPFTYISHCFRASGEEVMISVVILCLLTMIFLLLSNRVLKNNSDLHV